MPALSPAGGSLVTLVDICNNPRGKALSGSAVTNNRKLGSIPSLSFSQNSSIVCISSKPNSQFCSNTHVPLAAPVRQVQMLVCQMNRLIGVQRFVCLFG